MEKIGRFKVLRRLGGGGFGEVWLGLDETIKREVAIKVFKPKDEKLIAFTTSSNAEGLDVLRARFVHEAQILASLENAPHVINVLEFGELDDGSPYYAMPYLPNSLTDLLGKDVYDARAIEELPESDRPRSLPLAQSLTIVDQLLQGLSAAHDQGLVHRDIKPSNIMLTDTGEVRLVDFGIAKAPDGVHSTVSQLVMGSRNYMAPEQRESAKHVDASADVYAVGMVAYRLITGRLATGRFSDPNVLVPELHQSLNDLIVGSLKEDHEQRHASAGELLNAFRRARSQQGKIDESTGTWVADGVSSIRDELKPLRDQIEKLLLAHGEIPYEERDTLQAVAMVADLHTAGFDALVAQVEETLSQQFKPIKNYLGLIDARIAKTDFGDQDKRVLYAAGEAVGWDQAKVDSVISARLPKRDGGEPDELKAVVIKNDGPPVPEKDGPERAGGTKGVGAGRWVAIVVVLLLAAGGWWLFDRPQQQAERRAEQARQEGAAWDKAESIDTISAYESYQSQSFTTVTHKQIAANRIDTLTAESLRQAEKTRVARIAADKRAKEEAQRISLERVAQDTAERERLEKLSLENEKKIKVETARLAKLAAANSTGCVVGNCVSGFGMYRFPDGSLYEGNYQDGKRSAQGSSYFKDGNRYEGNYKDDKYSGLGTFYWKDGSRYEGNWKNSKRFGQGTYYSKDGNRYEGNYKDDQYSGQGTFYWKNGSRYEGKWKNDKRSGQGTYYWEDGSRYEGKWKDDKRSGPGTLYAKDGARRKQNYKDGKLVR